MTRRGRHPLRPYTKSTSQKLLKKTVSVDKWQSSEVGKEDSPREGNFDQNLPEQSGAESAPENGGALKQSYPKFN